MVGRRCCGMAMHQTQCQHCAHPWRRLRDGRAGNERYGEQALRVGAEMRDLFRRSPPRAGSAAPGAGGGHLLGVRLDAHECRPAALMETDDALWQRHIQINQYGCFLGMKAVVPAMERSGGGSIVNISSVAGLKGSPGSFAYAATKWALRGMTKSAAIDLGGHKIRVNSVHPGPIDTDMISFRTPEQRETRIKQVPLHRVGT